MSPLISCTFCFATNPFFWKCIQSFVYGKIVLKQSMKNGPSEWKIYILFFRKNRQGEGFELLSYTESVKLSVEMSVCQLAEQFYLISFLKQGWLSKSLKFFLSNLKCSFFEILAFIMFFKKINKGGDWLAGRAIILFSRFCKIRI